MSLSGRQHRCMGGRLEGTDKRKPNRQRLDRVKNIVQDTILANNSGGRPNRVAKIKQTIGLDQRSVSIGDLVGPGIEEIEHVELDTPAAVVAIADASDENAGSRRAERVVFGERA